MNHIYRRIWSTARRCWVVASELSPARGKASRSVTAPMLVAVLSLPGLAVAADVESIDVDAVGEESSDTANRTSQTVFGSAAARFEGMPSGLPGLVIPITATYSQFALVSDANYKNSILTGDNLLVVGSRSWITGSTSVAFGNNIGAHGEHNVAIGFSAATPNGYATAVGGSTLAAGVGSVALGNNAKSYTLNSISIGSGSSSYYGSGNSRIAIGGDAYAGTSGYTGATALGGNARAEYDGLSLGYGSKAAAVGAVALGTNSQATEANAVSVGSSSIKRRVINLADARLSATSTDAVTGKQLHATNTRLDAATYAVASGTAMTGNNKAAASGSGALAAGALASAVGGGAAAMGNMAKADGTHTTALGYRAQAIAGQATALGRESVASGSFSTAVGNLSQATQTSAVAVGDRALAQHSGSVALGNGSQTSAANQVSVGSASIKRKIVNVADAALNTASTEAVTGKQLHATNQNLAAVKAAADAATNRINARAVAFGSGAIAEGTTYGQSAALGDQARAYNGQSLALGADARAGVDSEGNKAAGVNGGVAVGALSRSGNGAVALGQRSSAVGDRGIAVGNDALANATHATAVGFQAKAGGNQATALGRGAQADGVFASALGNMAKATADSSIALGDRALSQHAASVALGSGSQTSAANQVSVGSASVKRRIVNLADGAVGAGSNEAVTGNQLHATNQAVNTARTTADSALAKANTVSGLVGQTAASGNVRLGAENTGTVLDVANKTGVKRRIYNIANGVLSAGSTDAVTGQQLFATNALVEGNASQLKGHAQQLLAQDGRIGDNRSDLDRLREDVDNFDPDLEGVVKFSDGRSYVDLEGARLEGVAAGDISLATSTDAVNGGQLFATNSRIELIERHNQFINIDFDDRSREARSGHLGIAIGESSEASLNSDGATAIGTSAKARAKNSVAVGRGAFVDGSAINGFALGVGANVYSANSVAIGAFTEVADEATNGVALGGASVATEMNTVSVGNSSLKRRIVNVARGTMSGDVVTFAQASEIVEALGGGATFDFSGNLIAPVYQIQGGEHRSVGNALSALDGAVLTADARVNSIEHQLRSVFQNTPSTRSDGLPQLNLAGANGMVLGNVANGVIAAGSRDAVNGGQLHAMQQRLDGRIDGIEQRIDGQPQAQGRMMASADASTEPTAPVTPDEQGSKASGTPTPASAGDTPTGRIASADGGKPAAAESPTPQVSTRDLEQMLERANQYTDQATAGIERRLEKMDKRFNRMAAMNSAQSAMAMNTAGLATYNRLGAGVGYAEGESAMAVGYQRVLNDKGSATFSLNGAFTNSGERSMGVGVGIGW